MNSTILLNSDKLNPSQLSIAHQPRGLVIKFPFLITAALSALAFDAPQGIASSKLFLPNQPHLSP